MVKGNTSGQNGRVFRVDKFVVPEPARPEFAAAVEMTHRLLRTLPGFVRDLVLDQTSGPGEFNFVTIVEWESAASVENAKSAVVAGQRRAGLDPPQLLRRLGIRADMGVYQKMRINDLS